MPVNIGLTGRVCSGKSKASHIIEQHFNVHHLDLDKVGHELLHETAVIAQLISTFGTSILNPDGQINRANLGTIVFSSPKKLKELNILMHPLIRKYVTTHVSSTMPNLISGALLDEIKLLSVCKAVIVIDADDDLIRRFSKEKFDKISPSQQSREAYRKQGTHIIENDFSEAFTDRCIQTFKTLV